MASNNWLIVVSDAFFNLPSLKIYYCGKDFIHRKVDQAFNYIKEKARMKAPSPELSLSEQMTAKKLREEWVYLHAESTI